MSSKAPPYHHLFRQIARRGLAIASRCSCGGDLRRETVKRLEISVLFGLCGTLEGPLPALRCARCRALTFEGDVLEQWLVAVAREVLAQRRILTAAEARFLRKAVLARTQAKLARLMGINPITVADWERGERALSKEHDYELRGIALASLLARLPERARQERDELMRACGAMLGGPRLVRPPKRARRYKIGRPRSAAA